MRVKLAIAVGVGAAIGFGAVSLAPHAVSQMQAWKQLSNNNKLAEAQYKKQKSTTGDVKFDYYGHSAVKVTSPAGISIMFDPWRNDPSGAWGLWYQYQFPMTRVDIGMSTHAHFDHDALDRLDATMLLDRMTGDFALGDLEIKGIADKHVCIAPGKVKWTDAVIEFGFNPCPPNNPTHMDNNLYLVETGGLRILVWGDNRPNAPDAVLNKLGSVDVAMLPVDGSGHILTGEQADAIAKRLKAKVIIPIHYRNTGVSYALTTLESAETYVNAHPSKMLASSSSVTLTKDQIKDKTMHVVYFGDNVIKPQPSK